MNKKIWKTTAEIIMAFCMLFPFISIPVSGAEMVEKNIYGPDGFNWQLPALSTPWAGSVSGGSSKSEADPDNNGNNALKIARTAAAGGLNTSFKLDTAIAQGTIGVEFDIKMRGVDGKFLEVMMRDTSGAQLASLTFKQANGITIRLGNNGPFVTAPGTENIRLNSTDDYVRVKLETNLNDKYINAYIGNAPVYTINGLVSTSVKDFSYFFMQSQASADNVGVCAYIDNFRMYELADAQALANEVANAIDLGDLSAPLSDNLTLPKTGAYGATIDWQSTDSGVIDSNGVITKTHTIGNAVLTAIVTIGQTSVSRQFAISIAINKTDEDFVDEAIAAIDLGNLENIESDLILPAKGINNTNITWSSNNEGVITSSGKISRFAQTGSAVLTASVTRNTTTKTKDFPVTVAADLTKGPLNWVVNDTFDYALLPSGWISSTGKIENGRFIIDKPDTSASGATRNLSYTVNGDIYIEHDYTLNASGDKKAQQEIIRGLNKAGEVVGLITIRYMQNGDIAYRTQVNDTVKYIMIGNAELAAKNTTHTIGYRVNLITQTMDISIDNTLYLSNIPFPNTTDTITAITSLYWTSGSTDFPIRLEMDNFKVGLQEIYKDIVESDLENLKIENQNKIENDFNLSVLGALGSSLTWTSNHAAISVDANGRATVTRPASNMQDVVVELTATSTYKTYQEVRTISVTVKRELTVAEALENAKTVLTDGVILDKNTSINEVLTDLYLPKAWVNNTIINWSSDSPLIVVDGSIGRVNGNLIDEALLEQTVRLTAVIEKEGQTITKTIDVSVRNAGYTNIAKNVNATASSALATNLANTAVDDKSTTSWIANTFDEKPFLMLNLGKATSINRIELIEKNSVMNQFKVEYSQNGSNWVSLLSGGSMGEGEVKEHVFDPIIVQYLRYTVTSKQSGETGLYEFKVFKRYNDEVRLFEDMEALDIPGKNEVTSDITLPVRGLNGTVFTWESSNESVVSSFGAVSRLSSLTNVTLTATGTLGGKTKTKLIPLRIPGTNNENSSGGGGGGGYVGGQRNNSTVVPPAITPAMPESTGDMFRDVQSGYWAKEYIESLKNRNILNGVDDSHFAPERNITRAEFVKLLTTAFSISGSSYFEKFEDVKESDWYAAYVLAAMQQGIANGMSDSYFGADEYIKRQDMAVMLHNTLRIKGIKLKEESTELAFRDSSDISAYASESIGLLSANAIIKGTPQGDFEPNSYATRAQVAKVLYVLLEQIQ